MSATARSEISIVPSREGHAVQVLTDLCRVKVSGKQTGGAYSVIEVSVPPGGGPPLHRHPSAETFIVLDGQFAIARADRSEITARAGDTVHIPEGEPHGYRNTADAIGRLIAIIAPSDLEAFFDDLGTPADGATEPQPLTGPPDMDRLLAVTARHGVEML